MSWEDMIKLNSHRFSTQEGRDKEVVRIELVERLEEVLREQADGKPLPPTNRPSAEIDREVVRDIIAALKDGFYKK